MIFDTENKWGILNGANPFSRDDSSIKGSWRYRTFRYSLLLTAILIPINIVYEHITSKSHILGFALYDIVVSCYALSLIPLLYDMILDFREEHKINLFSLLLTVFTTMAISIATILREIFI